MPASVFDNKKSITIIMFDNVSNAKMVTMFNNVSNAKIVTMFNNTNSITISMFSDHVRKEYVR